MGKIQFFSLTNYFQFMATIAFTAAIRLISVLILSLELDLEEAVEAYIARRIQKVPRLYRQSLHHQYH
jgi:hypothetical protein